MQEFYNEYLKVKGKCQSPEVNRFKGAKVLRFCSRFSSVTLLECHPARFRRSFDTLDLRHTADLRRQSCSSNKWAALLSLQVLGNLRKLADRLALEWLHSHHCLARSRYYRSRIETYLDKFCNRSLSSANHSRNRMCIPNLSLHSPDKHQNRTHSNLLFPPPKCQIHMGAGTSSLRL